MMVVGPTRLAFRWCLSITLLNIVIFGEEDSLNPLDKETTEPNKPVGFNCAAKYVDYNGGWVVDVVRTASHCHTSPLKRA